jgi:hypothetical protein
MKGDGDIGDPERLYEMMNLNPLPYGRNGIRADRYASTKQTIS